MGIAALNPSYNATTLNCGGLILHGGVMSALRLMCEEVEPRFQLARLGI